MNAQMDDNSIGTSATGTNAVAMGMGTTASGSISTSTNGSRSTAMGSGTLASGNIRLQWDINSKWA